MAEGCLILKIPLALAKSKCMWDKETRRAGSKRSRASAKCPRTTGDA